MTENAVALPLIAALPYEEGAYPDFVLEALVRELQSEGRRVAGVIQHDLTRRDRSRCDMSLEDLTSGTLIGLSEDRGSAARGCRIDQSGLMQAASLVAEALESGRTELLVINKFGKIESEGGGLRDVIAEAASQGISTVVGVPMRNLDAWNAFAGTLAEAVVPNREALAAWLETRLPRRSAALINRKDGTSREADHLSEAHRSDGTDSHMSNQHRQTPAP